MSWFDKVNFIMRRFYGVLKEFRNVVGKVINEQSTGK